MCNCIVCCKNYADLHINVYEMLPRLQKEETKKNNFVKLRRNKKNRNNYFLTENLKEKALIVHYFEHKIFIHNNILLR